MAAAALVAAARAAAEAEVAKEVEVGKAGWAVVLEVAMTAVEAAG